MSFLFESLHDATLVSTEFIWQTGSVNILLRTSTNPDFKLRVTEVKAFQVTRNFDWGPSEQLNDIKISEELVSIEMQSGDIIQIQGRISIPA